MIRFPIFMPSTGCAEHGLLDLSDAMVCRGRLDGTVECGKMVEYVQITVVKSNELDVYQKNLNQPHIMIFELPESANDLGIGALRFHLKNLAQKICPESFQFCFMLDDSVQYWRGITLPDDPTPLFGDLPSCSAQLCDISLADVLLHFQQGAFTDLCKFAMIGFQQLSQYSTSKGAYARKHIYSAVIMNLEVECCSLAVY